MSKSSLPGFDNPPLNEMVVGIQFEPLERFRGVHFGVYWAKIRDRYPTIEDQPPVARQIESGEPVPNHPQPITLMRQPLPHRCWYIGADTTQLIQLQMDHFWRNWRKVSGDEEYPRYPHLIREFKDEWKAFNEFVIEEDLGTILANQCELTYINHIERGIGWESFSDISRVFPVFQSAKADGRLPEPELVAWDIKYKLPDDAGRLHATMTPVFRAADFKMVLSLEITVRGAPAGKTNDEVLGWFDAAHGWVVQAFAELTGPTMHEVWGMQK